MESRRVNKQQRENFTDSHFQQRTISREPVIRGFVFRETFHISHAAFPALWLRCIPSGTTLHGKFWSELEENHWWNESLCWQKWAGPVHKQDYCVDLAFKVGSQAFEIKALPTLLKPKHYPEAKDINSAKNLFRFPFAQAHASALPTFEELCLSSWYLFGRHTLLNPQHSIQLQGAFAGNILTNRNTSHLHDLFYLTK